MKHEKEKVKQKTEEEIDPSEWLGWLDLANEELARFTGQQHEVKRRDTVIALVLAHIMPNVNIEQVWDDEWLPGFDRCQRNIYYGFWKGDKGSPNRRYKVGWRDDPLFIDILAKCKRIAMDWKTKTVAAGMVHSLAVHSRIATRRVGELIESRNQKIALAASFGTFDRITTQGKEDPDKEIAKRIKAFAQNVDYSKLNKAQLDRIANGEDVLSVLLDEYTSNPR